MLTAKRKPATIGEPCAEIRQFHAGARQRAPYLKYWNPRLWGGRGERSRPSEIVKGLVIAHLPR
jgi:hypothetical protein